VDPVPVVLSVSIDTRHPGARIQREFLGLSFEMSSLRQIARYGGRGNMVALLRSLGPGLLRFGGVSADTEVAWTDAATSLPAWSSKAVGAYEFRDIRKLAARSGWHVLLTIGLAHFEPRAAAREAAAAQRALGRWLTGIEIGNEPDAYARHRMRLEPWTFSRYEVQVSAYRRAIEQAAPGLRIAGPDVSGSLIFDSWGRGAALHDKPLVLTGHHYPLGCRTLPEPTIARLLSPETRRAEGASLHRYLAVSRRGAIGFRLDEANSVSCGGLAGISDRFASALWAVDYIAHLMLGGATGINLQGNPANCSGYTPLCASSPRRLAQGVLTARPEWYALLMAKALVGDRPVRTILSPSPSKENVDVLALRSRERQLHVLIVDDNSLGTHHVAVQLHVGNHYGSATVRELTAPSPTATTGVRIDGQVVEPDGQLRLPPPRKSLLNRAGVITVDLAPASAMLLTISDVQHAG
jgi:hypothetical protein